MALAGSARLGALVAATLGIGFVFWLMAEPALPRTNTTHSRDGVQTRGEASENSARDESSRTWRLRYRPFFRGADDSEESEMPARQAVQAGPQSGETTPHWNSLPPAERVARLEQTFNTALDELRAGDSTAASRAATALTALRSELYATPEGRERHAELEQQLDSLTKD